MDTDVWLDLAKDYRKAPVLTALDGLVRAGAIELVMPEIVIDEFERNRDRVVEHGRRSLSSHIRRVREALPEFGDENRLSAVVAQLDEMEHQVAVSGDVSHQRLEAIAGLMATSPATPVSGQCKAQGGRTGIVKTCALPSLEELRRGCAAGRDVRRGSRGRWTTGHAVLFRYPQHEGFFSAQRRPTSAACGSRTGIPARELHLRYFRLARSSMNSTANC